MSYPSDVAWEDLDKHVCHQTIGRLMDPEESRKASLRESEMQILEDLINNREIKRNLRTPKFYPRIVKDTHPDRKKLDDFVENAMSKEPAERTEIASLRLFDIYTNPPEGYSTSRAKNILRKSKAGIEMVMDIACDTKYPELREAARKILKEHEADNSYVAKSMSPIIGAIIGAYVGFVTGMWPPDDPNIEGPRLFAYVFGSGAALAAASYACTAAAYKIYHLGKRLQRKLTFTMGG